LNEIFKQFPGEKLPRAGRVVKYLAKNVQENIFMAQDNHLNSNPHKITADTWMHKKEDFFVGFVLL
jgi:hypothetical protein